MPKRSVLAAAALTILGAALVASPDARAFCGFYVGGADAKLFNNATMVVLMRDGTRTVLSMQNNYQGPPSDFAMVVPVPVVLQQENVKTLPRELFDRVDTLAAPRLVEYWEQDPCWKERPHVVRSGRPSMVKAVRPEAMSDDEGGHVRVEAQFTVGEYEIVILSADDALALDRWIRGNGYKIPDGAAEALRPYVAAGMKFFVAKVDLDKVQRDGERTLLSPLRFHYDSEKFELPVRLGLLNSSGTQDLIVHILATERYEVANYKNVFIPTNLGIAAVARARFGEFYAALFDATMQRNPGAVVTEYAWQAMKCDPCPGGATGGGALRPQDLTLLGADVVSDANVGARMDRSRGGATPFGFVLTRLHTRYGKATLGDDLVFRVASAVVGGREVRGESGRLEHGAAQADTNNFQGRYIIRNRWTGRVACANPIWGRWGGPPGGGEPALMAAKGVAFAPRGKVKLRQLLKQSVPELGIWKRKQQPAGGATSKPDAPR